MDKLFSKKTPIVTYILILLNIIMFIISALKSGSFIDIDANTLVSLGGNYRGTLYYHEYYRLLTSAFLHGGLLHLLFNSYALYIIGTQIENYFGKIKYILIYIVSAVGASLLSLLFNDAVCIGASGAIFGLLGALLYFGYYYRVYLGEVLKSQIIPLILLNLFIGFMNPTIDNSAHIGGLITGVLLSMAVGVTDKTEKREKINGYVMTLIYFIFVIIMINKFI